MTIFEIAVMVVGLLVIVPLWRYEFRHTHYNEPRCQRCRRRM